MFRWFQSRRKLLREIKLQEEYIEILRKELDHQLEITGERIRGLEEVANKSGIATKRGLTFTAQVIDADYTGEIHIGLQNNSNRMVTLQSNDKIIQFLHTPIILSTMEEVTNDSYNDILESNTIDR